MISVFSEPPISEDPPPKTVISTLLRLGSQSSDFFGRGALAPQSAALPNGKLRAQFRFRKPCQREIQIVAAQQKMLADSSARELDVISLASYADQAEVAGAAAHIADEHNLTIEQLLARLRQIVSNPRIKRSRRLFEQREIR